MDWVAFLLLVAVGIAIYFTPMLVAAKREHPQMYAIAALNILLGWTALGWIAALVWSLTAIRKGG